METVQKPWGSYTVLDNGPTHQVKRLEVLPGKRLSYQLHHHRSEHWFLVQGIARVTLDGQDRTVETGQDVDVAVGQAHRIGNPGSELLVFIEVQQGDYLGEDDIVRLEDDFGRVPA